MNKFIKLNLFVIATFCAINIKAASTPSPQVLVFGAVGATLIFTKNFDHKPSTYFKNTLGTLFLLNSFNHVYEDRTTATVATLATVAGLNCIKYMMHTKPTPTQPATTPRSARTPYLFPS